MGNKKYCNKCGAEIPSNSLFCNKCGEKIIIEEKTEDIIYDEDELKNVEEIQEDYINNQSKKIIKYLLWGFLFIIIIIAMYLNQPANTSIDILCAEYNCENIAENGYEYCIKHLSQNKINIKNDIPTIYKTGYEINPEYKISDEDYKLYTEIMNVLQSDYSKTEDELLATMTKKYSKSVSELKNFLNENMTNAIERDLGKTINDITITMPQVLQCGINIIKNSVDDETIISNKEEDWTITNTGLRYLLKTTFLISDNSIDAIIKIEFNDNYSEYTLFQLKYNDKNIDL